MRTVDVDGLMRPILSSEALMKRENVIALRREATRPRERPRSTIMVAESGRESSWIVSSSSQEPVAMFLTK